MARGSRSGRRVLLWLALATAVGAAVRVLRGPATSGFDDRTTWNDGAAWPLVEEADTTSPAPAHEIDLRPVPDDPASELEPALVPVPADRHVAWVEPFEGQCPPGYPVKAKLASGIFHQPGGAMYDRTKPDRCYASPTDAIADGLRPAKR